MKLWLDDIRPKPDFTWTHVKTVEEAKKMLLTGEVEDASLDHDLGACEECMSGMNLEDWMENSNWNSMPNCDHFGTGYTLICWMEENNVWPKNKPTVHSANPVGRQKMQQVIDKRFP